MLRTPHSVLAISVLVMLLLLGCSRSAKNNTVKIKGSDTVLPVAQEFAEYFAQEVDSIEVSVTGGGSGVGIAALLENTTDIAMTSRDLKLSEKIRLQESEDGWTQHTIAYDALAVVVHPSNPVSELTREQMEAIYTGDVTNWQEVGGPDMGIVVISRESSSGTHAFFKEAVLDDREFAARAMMSTATGAVIQTVSQTEGAVGYVGLAYLNDQVKALNVSYDQGATFVEPNDANAENGSYPIVRPLFFIYLNEKAEKVAPFIEYVLSEKGQEAVAKTGYLRANLSSQQAEPTPTDSTATDSTSTEAPSN